MKAQSLSRPVVLALLILASALLSCAGRPPAPETAPPERPPLVLRALESPAGAQSGQPGFSVAADGRLILSWVERTGAGRHALRFAMREGERWTEARTVAEGADWFVNWADVPSVVSLPDGTLAAHWLVKSGAATYAYDVRVSRSTDGGRAWSQPLTPHTDRTPTEHGFVSLFPWTDGRLAVAWLDGRKYQTTEHAALQGGARLLAAQQSPPAQAGVNEMTLRFALVGADGRLAEETLLDERVCDCCPTAAALTAAGPIVVYRDRSAGEIRDIYAVRYRDGNWTAPQPVHRDNWEINGCPVNGPSVAAAGQRLAVAWTTEAGERPRVQLVFSEDAGATFGQAIEIDARHVLGRVNALLLDDGSALVSWLVATPERSEPGAAIKVRRVWPDGRMTEALTVAEASPGRASGVPRMTRMGAEIFFAWTETGEPARVRVAIGKIQG